MIIFTNNKTTNFCQITLRIKRIIHERQVVPFFCLTVYISSAVENTVRWCVVVMKGAAGQLAMVHQSEATRCCVQ